MIIGIGIDSVHIPRIQHWLDTPGILKRFFHPDELSQIMNKKKCTAESLAARFAAKEAFGKALGIGLRGIRLSDMLVLNTASGKPEIHVYNTALAALQHAGGKKIHISITHEKDTASAVVIIEGDIHEKTDK